MPNIQHDTYGSLKRRILSLDLKPGSALSEGRLAEEYGVSRTPIREALIRLSGEGLIDNSSRHRTYVTAIRFDMVMDGQFAREALETAIVHDVAQNMTDAIRAKLDANLARQVEAMRRGNHDRLYELDELMHGMLASFCRRPGIWKFVVDRKVHTDRLRKLTLTPDHIPHLLNQHRDILSALFSEDPAAAAEAMRVHLRFIVENYHELSKRHPHFVELPPIRESRSGTAFVRQGRPPKLSPGQREEVLDLLKQDGMTGAKAAQRFGVSPATISRIKRYDQ